LNTKRTTIYVDGNLRPALKQAQTYGEVKQAQTYGEVKQVQTYGEVKQAQTYGEVKQAQTYCGVKPINGISTLVLINCVLCNTLNINKNNLTRIRYQLNQEN
jgi:hypothetical protein